MSPTLACRSLGVRIDDTDVLAEVTLELHEHRIAVLGANGSGKSTFARVLGGLARPTAGDAAVDGVPVSDTRRLRGTVGMVFANADAQIIMPTPAEDVALSLGHLPQKERTGAALEALRLAGLGPRADAPAFALSGGEKQLLALTSVLATRPRVLIADEPTTMLDLRNARRIGDLLLADEAPPLILVTHDLDLAARCDVAVRFDAGRLVDIGPPSRVVADYRVAA